MSEDGAGDGGAKKPETGVFGLPILKPPPGGKPPGLWTPEQTCLGCGVTFLVIVVGLIVGGYLIWWYAPVFRYRDETAKPVRPAPSYPGSRTRHPSL